ncbi:MAG: ABC transporter substrate-binding protein [Acidimicrobiales bacterium]
MFVPRGASHRGTRRSAGLVGLLAMLIAACGPPGGEEPGPGADGPLNGDGARGEPVRVGIVTFLTGPAAEPFGVPARNGAELLVEELNNGALPAPYDVAGFGARPIEAVYVDEAGGAEAAVSNYRRLVEDEQVDVVIGYISSGDCLAVAPVAEQLQQFTVFFDCGTSELFAEAELTFVFRTAGDQVTDSVGAARYLIDTAGEIGTMGGINQNYQWGRDSWTTFRASMEQVASGVQTEAELFPELFAGDYSAEISNLLSARPEVVHSSLWGGDLDSLLTQALPRALAEESTLVLTTADTALPGLGQAVPAGIAVGARGPHGALAPDNELNTWLVETYTERFGGRPTYPVYHMAQAFLGVKTAWENAGAANDTDDPTVDQVMAELEGLSFDTPSGTIEMGRANGHQALEGSAYGVTGDFDAERGEVELVDVKTYSPECVNPPADMTVPDWLASGFRGSSC